MIKKLGSGWGFGAIILALASCQVFNQFGKTKMECMYFNAEESTIVAKCAGDSRYYNPTAITVTVIDSLNMSIYKRQVYNRNLESSGLDINIPLNVLKNDTIQKEYLKLKFFTVNTHVFYTLIIKPTDWKNSKHLYFERFEAKF
jgi:hypothetical protein